MTSTTNALHVHPRTALSLALVRGIGQIMLQSNGWTGLLFLLGLLVGNWQVAVGTLIGVTVGTLIAYALRFDAQGITNGLYGFSPALVGAAAVFFFGLNLPAVVLGVVGAAMAAWLQRTLAQRKVAVYTLPFVVVAWVVHVVGVYGLGLANAADVQPLVDLPVGAWAALFNGIGQVIFQGAPVAGVLFVIGLAMAGAVPAAAGVLGALIGILLAILTAQAQADIALGLFGYNSALAAITLAGQPVRTTWAAVCWVVVASVVAFILHLFFRQFTGMDMLGGVLTLPFVVAVWVVAGLRRVVNA
ncbi:urea transporter [Moraxella atlantae]|uniref:urea transporter n=1 Tax=Faucicola atlantae TaxID=34059 RepID=UPI003753E268